MDEFKITESELVALLQEAAAQAPPMKGMGVVAESMGKGMSIGINGLSKFIQEHGLEKSVRLIMGRVKVGASNEAS